MVSELNEVTKGAVLSKTGAEGVVTAALPERGLGIALKIADGSARARSVALLAIIDHLGALSDEEKHQLQAHISPTIVDSRGIVVGEIRPVFQGSSDQACPSRKSGKPPYPESVDCWITAFAGMTCSEII